MSTQTTTVGDVEVRLDNRIRLISAILATTNYPEETQKAKPHGTHAHARATRKHLDEFSVHPAALLTQAMLDKGTPVEALFALALYLDPQTLEARRELPNWMPKDWDKLAVDFYERANLEQWWKDERLPWDKSIAECQRVFSGVNYKKFFNPYFPNIQENLVFIPNVSYPTGNEIGLRFDNDLICIAPPPLAWGDSPPWPFDEETNIMHSHKVALVQYGRIMLLTYLRKYPDALEKASKTPLPVNDQFREQYPGWEEQFTELFVHALVAMYLEEFINEAEYKAFVLIEKKHRGMNILPGTVSVLRRFLQEKGNKYESLVDFLPIFPKQLRVAKRIVTL